MRVQAAALGVSSPANHVAEMTKAGGKCNSTGAPELHFDPDTECSAAIITRGNQRLLEHLNEQVDRHEKEWQLLPSLFPVLD